MAANGLQPVHGTRSRYRKGCRDECCRSVEMAYQRRYRARKRAEQERAA